MRLKECLFLTPHGNKSITAFLNLIKSIIFKLAFINTPMFDDDIVIHILNKIRLEFKELAVALCARGNLISFKELQGKLKEYEFFLKWEENHTDA